MKKTKAPGNLVARQFLSGILATLLAAALTFGLVTFAAANNLDRSSPLPTAYDTIKNQVEEKSIPAKTNKDYIKADYTVIYSDIYQNGAGAIYPSAEHVSANQAAEIAAREIWKIFGISMEGLTIQLALFPDHGRYSSRPEWICDVEYGNFSVDTGHGVLEGGITVTLDGIDGTVESAGIISELHPKNISEKDYEDAAKKLVADLKLFDQPIQSVTYFDEYGGYSKTSAGSDGTRTNFDEFEAYGGNVGVVAENGDIVMLTISAEELSIVTVSYGARAEREYKAAKEAASGLWRD